MSGPLGNHFIVCVKCGIQITIPEFPITTEGPIRYEIRDSQLFLYAKCTNPACEHDNMYSVLKSVDGDKNTFQLKI